jgi:leader peptidase (prepilin peptidase)/N-methyltransferase
VTGPQVAGGPALVAGAAVLGVVLTPWLARVTVRLAARNREARPTGRRVIGTAVLLVPVLGASAAFAGARPALLGFAWVAGAAVVLGAVDLVSHRLPDRVTYPAAVICAAAFLADAVALGTWPALLRAALAAGAAFGVATLAAATSPAGLGFGDVKLLGMLGLVLGWVGWEALLTGVFLGLVVGALAAVTLLATRRVGWRTALPFGPLLLVGAALALALHGPLGAA